MCAARWLVLFVALFCVSAERSQAQEFVKNQRLFSRKSFFPVVAGSPYDRLRWPRPSAAVGRQAKTEITLGNAGRPSAAKPGKSSALSTVAPPRANSGVSSGHTPLSVAKSPTLKNGSLKKAPIEPLPRQTSWLWRTMAVAAAVGAILFALTRLRPRWRIADKVEETALSPKVLRKREDRQPSQESAPPSFDETLSPVEQDQAASPEGVASTLQPGALALDTSGEIGAHPTLQDARKEAEDRRRYERDRGNVASQNGDELPEQLRSIARRAMPDERRIASAPWLDEPKVNQATLDTVNIAEPAPQDTNWGLLDLPTSADEAPADAFDEAPSAPKLESDLSPVSVESIVGERTLAQVVVELPTRIGRTVVHLEEKVLEDQATWNSTVSAPEGGEIAVNAGDEAMRSPLGETVNSPSDETQADAVPTPIERIDEASTAETHRLVRVTVGNLRNSHLYLPLDFFPEDAVGGSNRLNAAPKKIAVKFDPGDKIETDLDGTKRMLRDRSAIRGFFAEGGFKEGDLVRIDRIAPYSYLFTKEGSQEARSRDRLRRKDANLVDSIRDPDVGALLPEVDIGPNRPGLQPTKDAPVGEVCPTDLAVDEGDSPTRTEEAEASSVTLVDEVIGCSESSNLITAIADTENDSGSVDRTREIPVQDAVGSLVEGPDSSKEEVSATDGARPPIAIDTAPATDVLQADNELARAAPTAIEQQPAEKLPELRVTEEAPGALGPEKSSGDSGLQAPKISDNAENTASLPDQTLETLATPESGPTKYPLSPAPVAPELRPTFQQIDKTSVPEPDRAVAKPTPTQNEAAYAKRGQKWQADLFGEILARAGIGAPDGRPLYSYVFTDAELEAIEVFVARRIRTTEALESTGAAFVFWAAEHIRARFPSEQERHLNWAFLFEALGITEDQTFARRLVPLGLHWWGRNVREAANGNQLHLYSLMVEGGLPEALLRQEGLYQRVIRGLVEEIEASGGSRCGLAVAEQLAARFSTALPPIFQGNDLVRLLADFGFALAQLRSTLPSALPPEKIQAWLAENRPNWEETLPLRASPETINRLIVPALQIERVERRDCAPEGGLVARELRRDIEGCWRGFIRFAEEAWVPGALLPDARDLRLRLIPSGALAASEAAPSLFAVPEGDGWRTRLVGRSRTAVISLALSAPVHFAALDDGRSKGEIELDGGLPDPTDAITLWRPATTYDGASEDLLSLSPSGSTRAPFLFALGPAGARPTASGGLSLAEEPQPTESGELWRVSGKGEIAFGDFRLKIETAADTDAPQARLFAFGRVFPGWKTARGAGNVFLGCPRLLGQRGDEDPRELPPARLATRPTRGRVFAEHVVEWVDKGAGVARLRYISLPENTRIRAREVNDGEARLTIEGLDLPGLRVTARAGDANGETTLSSGSGEILLKTRGAAPGEIELTLTHPAEGTSLALIAPWPARRGMMLRLDGRRLARRTAIAVEELSEWRAIAPPHISGRLHIAIGGRKITSLVAGEAPLGVYLPLIKALLAQGEPNAQVNVWLETDGLSGQRLEVRRYVDNAAVRNGVLLAGIDRDAPAPVDNVFTDALTPRHPITLHAVDQREGTSIRLEAVTPCDLRTALGKDGGPWLIQARLNGRPQRPVVFNSRAPASAQPEGEASPSIAARHGPPTGRYLKKWRALANAPLDPDWSRLWNVIEALAEGGDAGFASQTRALAETPEAAIMLMLRVRRKALQTALDLDHVTPLFWPVLRVEAFTEAIIKDYDRRRIPLLETFGATEAEREAGDGLFARISDILIMRPELIAHFGRALVEAGLIQRALQDGPQAIRASLASTSSLDALAQEVAKRANFVPEGLKGLSPRYPLAFSFNTHTQAVVDAPIVTAEIAAGLRKPPTASETITLIGLRFVDPLYFDAAVPAALNRALEKK